MKREEVDALIPIDVDRLLRLWSDFMRLGTVGNGYPKRSAGISCGGINCWDDVEDELDSSRATEVNTVMNDLENRHYCAISNHYCSKVWRFRGDEMEILICGIGEFRKRAIIRGILGAA